MIQTIRSFFIKERTYECIVFDGKKMSYPHLTQKQIDEINTLPKYKDWIVQLKEPLEKQ